MTLTAFFKTGTLAQVLNNKELADQVIEMYENYDKNDTLKDAKQYMEAYFNFKQIADNPQMRLNHLLDKFKNLRNVPLPDTSYTDYLDHFIAAFRNVENLGFEIIQEQNKETSVQPINKTSTPLEEMFNFLTLGLRLGPKAQGRKISKHRLAKQIQPYQKSMAAVFPIT